MGNQIYKEISKFAEMQRDEIKREKAKKKRKAVCIDPDSVIGKEIMYQTALLHEILDEIRGESSCSVRYFFTSSPRVIFNHSFLVYCLTYYTHV